MEWIIETEGLTRFYGHQKVVDTVNLRIPRGCVYGLLGRNGAGKTTLIKMLMGVIFPDRGRIRIRGKDFSELSPDWRQNVAYMPEGHPLFGWMTVQGAVDFSRSFYPAWNNDLVLRLLDHFKLPLKKRIRSLSRGQRAQAALALAVAPDPDVFILDDPTLGLDTVVRREFLESLIQIIQRSGRTILFSSHILGDVERIADRIGILVDGVLRVDCSTEQFKESLRKVVLEFSGTPPCLPDIHGLVGAKSGSNRCELVIAGYNETHRAQLEVLAPCRIAEIEMNLEDAFIEYTRSSNNSVHLLFEEHSPGGAK